MTLERVKSFEKQTEILNVLHSSNPTHYERLWMVGFLKYVGYCMYEILEIIDIENCWGDYDRRMTYNQVASVFRLAGRKRMVKDESVKKSILERKKDGVPYCSVVYTPCSRCPDFDGLKKKCIHI